MTTTTTTNTTTTTMTMTTTTTTTTRSSPRNDQSVPISVLLSGSVKTLQPPRTQSRGRLPPSLLGTSSPFRHRHELSRRCRCRNRQRVGMDCVQGMLGVGCRRGRGQILFREGEGDGKCRIGFCFVCSFISVVVVSFLPVRYWDPDWGFVDGSGFVCVGSVILGEWMVRLCFTRTLGPSPLFPGTLLLSACFVFPNLSAIPYRTPFMYSVRSLPPPSASVSLRLHLRNRHHIHPLYVVLSPHPPTH
ncbi:hypothetical protein C8J55DRAFT_502948, partial [Lentinula edodes]